MALASLLLVAAFPAAPAAQRGAVLSMSPSELARIWDAEHVSAAVTPLVDHADVVQRLNAVAAAAPDLFTLEQIGQSVEGRSIHHVKAGTGPNACAHTLGAP